MQRTSGFRDYLPTTLLISLGFFTMGLMDPLYDTFVPLFLQDYVSSKWLVGAIMTVDNWFALFLIPIVAVWSDAARTKIGRRMPFILGTVPASAVLFACLPFAAAASLGALMLVVVSLNVFKQGARGPVVALMPDIVPGEFRSEANGVINMSSAVAAIIGTVFLARLMDADVSLPFVGSVKGRVPFLVAAVLVVIAVVLLFMFVKERLRDGRAAEGRIPFWASLMSVAGERDKSALLVLVSIFLWFFGYQGVLPFVSMYLTSELGAVSGQAALGSGAVAIAMTVFAVPSGYLAHRLGRRRVIRCALFALTLVCVAMFLHKPLCAGIGLVGAPRLYSFLALMFFFGAFWIAVIANSFPMLWQMAHEGNIGVYTGLYYAFKESSSIMSPPLAGGVADLLELRWIFAVAAVAMLAAFVVMRGVRSGEATHAPETP